MKIEEITQLAKQFRKAIDDAFEWGVFGDEYPFSDFPNDCCDDVCDLFGEMLLEKHVHFIKVFGIYRYNNWDKQYPHVWLQLDDGTVIDLTGDQYKDNPIMLNYSNPCYIGRPNRLHQMFPKDEMEYRPYYGIDNYIDEKTRKRLRRLYRNIMLFYKDDNGEE